MKKLLCSYLLSLLFAAGPACASAPVIPNSEFGENGLALTDLGVGLDEAAAIAVQKDGRILVAGTSHNGIDNDMAVVRYLPDGSEDPTFLFSAGPVIGGGFGDDGVRALSVDAAGAISLAGYIEESGLRSGVVVRVLPSGQLDYNFGVLGVVVLENAGLGSDFYDIAILADAKILAAGSAESDISTTPPSTTPLLARFLPDGSIDPTFGSDGIQTDAEASGVLHGLAVLPDGRILAGGYSLDDTKPVKRRGLYLARHDSEGWLDSTFGDQGRVVVFDSEEEIIAYDIALLPVSDAAAGVVAGIAPDIIAVGEVIAAGGASSMMAARFLGDGSPDTSFSDNGVLVYDIGSNSAAYSVTVLDDGVILAAGYRDGPTGKDTVILSFGGSSATSENPAESSDPDNDPGEIINISSLKVEPSSFSVADASLYRTIMEAELLTTSLSGSDEISRAITALPDGTIYTAGSSGTGTDTAFMVAAYSESVPSGGAINTTGPVKSDYYTIATAPITDVTRVGALTGGTITLQSAGDKDCLTECEEACDEAAEEETTEEETDTDEEETDTCKEACRETCAVPTITKRGVVYSVEPNPEYDDSEEPDPPVDGGDGEDPDPVLPGDGTDPDPDNPFGRDKLFNLDDYFVLSGQTEDGEGVGEYSSQIADVNPQTVYYVRAYGLLSDGTLIYGNENVFKTNDSCFIATAAFGGIDDFAVRALRQFRDRFLKPYAWGQAFINTYYHFSPPIADMVEQSILLRLFVIVLLIPLVGVAMFMLYFPLPPFLTLQSILLVLLACRYAHLTRNRNPGWLSNPKKQWTI